MKESGKENIKTSESSKPYLKDTKHKESLHKNMTKHHLRFLEDSPGPVDELGSHENIAKTLFNIIRKQKGGKAIALIGKWGSGKSCVIEILKKIIEKENEIGLFIFDSWEHEGDPLRRSFLEKLLEYLKGKGWLTTKYNNEGKEGFEDEAIEEVSKNLSGKQSTERINSYPVLTTEGKVFSTLMAIFYPIGLAMIGKCLVIKGVCYTVALNLTALFLMLMPFAYIDHKYYHIKLKAKNKRNRKHEESVLSIIFNKTVEETVVERFETPDPTSLEFEKSFKTIVEKMLGVDEERSFVIVIDNLDRVEPATALRLLSTIKPFIMIPKEDNKEENKLYEKIWYIIPFDLYGLENLLGRSRKNGKGEERKTAVRGFIDKIFQLRVYVPSPILLNWQNYFKKKLKEVGITEENEIYEIRKAFDVLYKAKTSEAEINKGNQRNKIPSSPTPREIKLFINNLVESIIQRQNDSIPFLHHAVFIAIREYYPSIYEELPEKILSGHIPKKEQLGLLKDWQRDFASLYFNVPKNEALHILLWDKLGDALTKGDKEALNEIKEIPGVKNVVQQIIREKVSEWIDYEPFRIGYALYALPEEFLINTLREIENKVSKLESIKGIDKKSAQGITKLIEQFSSNDEFLENILTSVAKAIPVELIEEKG